MMQTLLIYTTVRYGSMLTQSITDRFKDDFPYMESCNMALIVPDKHINKESVSPGLLSTIVNEGGIIK